MERNSKLAAISSRKKSEMHPLQAMMTKRFLQVQLNQARERIDTQQKYSSEEYSWHLQRPAIEIFGSKESALSARGIAHRSEEFFQKELTLHSNALSIGMVKLTTQEMFKNHFCRAFAHAKLRDYQKAYEDYTAAIKAIPTSGPAYFNRAETLIKMGKFREAMKDMDAAIEHDPANRKDYYANRALLQRKMGAFSRAIADYERSALQRHGRRRSVISKYAKIDRTPLNPVQEFKKLSELAQNEVRGELATKLVTPPAERDVKIVKEIAELLRDIIVFKSVPQDLLLRLSTLAKFLTVKEGDYVFREGEVGSDMYVVLSGEVSVRKLKGSAKLTLQRLGNSADFSLPSDEVVLARISQGGSFGELADNAAGEERKRRASIFVDQDAQFLLFKTSPEADVILRELRSWQIEDRIRSLKQSPIFQHWKTETLQELVKKATVQQYAPNSILLKQGDPLQEFLVIRAGICNYVKEILCSDDFQVERSLPFEEASYAAILQDARILTARPSLRSDNECTSCKTGTILGAQATGELVVLENHEELVSPVTVKAVTTVEVLAFTRADIRTFIDEFYGESFRRLRQSLCTNVIPTSTAQRQFSKRQKWESRKKTILKKYRR